MRFSDRVRRAARSLGRFSVRELADKMEVSTLDERKAVSAYIRDFVQRGEAEQLEEGQYRYRPKVKKVTDRQRMWNVVRRMPGPHFNFDDIQQMTDIRRPAIKVFCRFLVREGFAERVKPGHFRRTGKKFEVDAPPDKKNSLRRRQYVMKKRGAIQALERASAAIEEARVAIVELEEGS